MPRIMGAMEGSNLAVSLSALSQQVSSAEDRRANEALLPRVDDPSSFFAGCCPVAVVCGLCSCNKVGKTFSLKKYFSFD